MNTPQRMKVETIPLSEVAVYALQEAQRSHALTLERIGGAAMREAGLGVEDGWMMDVKSFVFVRTIPAEEGENVNAVASSDL